MIKAYFSRPGKKNDIKKQLLEDIKAAQKQILVAVAYFNDEDIADAIMNSVVSDKRFIFNNADLNRKGNNTPVEVYKKLKRWGNHVVLGTHYLNEIPNYMHNKFIIIDDVVWNGSYNFTNQASQRNWECMVRIKDDKLVEQFIAEFEKMWFIGIAIREKLKYDYCDDCKKKVEDPLTHFGVIMNTCSWYDDPQGEFTFSVMCNGTERFTDFPGTCEECGETFSQSQMITLDNASSFWLVCHDCYAKVMNNLVKDRNKMFEDIGDDDYLEE